MKIEIILPFDKASLMAKEWAVAEEKTDFNDKMAADRCTLSYAAMELKKYLEKTVDTEIVILSVPSGDGQTITFEWGDAPYTACNYRLIPHGDGVKIYGDSRTGVLYGAYELLKMQGWRWYEPGNVGEVAAMKTDKVKYPAEIMEFKTEATLGRGFAQEGLTKESAELLIWMARNRLNLIGHGAHTHKLMKKLGIICREGGHFFDKIIDPDRIMPSGKTLWEEHSEWYGVPNEWEFIKENAFYTQPCSSQPEGLDFLAEGLVDLLMTRWKHGDEVDIWGFDVWGSVCHCPGCQKLGNGTDQLLALASHFRDYLNKARKEGRLDRDVKMALCAYEGTTSLEAPLNPIPQNLIDAGDFILFAPIVRCYEHPFGDTSCSYNTMYDNALKGWSDMENPIGMMALEYYNVSKLEDLPVLFTKIMQDDFKQYFKRGVRGFTYMHLPMTNWGVRAITQLLYAELPWNPNMDVAAYVAEYLQNRYGDYHREMAIVYEEIEQAWSKCTSWRAWKRQNLLRQMIVWDGKLPREKLYVDDHFGTPEDMEKMGEESERLLKDAYARLDRILQEAKNSYVPNGSTAEAVNPIEQMKNQRNNMLLYALGEDKRILIYGVDTMALMLRVGKYYNALYARNFALADALWQEIDALEQKMESYYVPLVFQSHRAEVYSYSALRRTQLADTLQRCRAFRNSAEYKALTEK